MSSANTNTSSTQSGASSGVYNSSSSENGAAAIAPAPVENGSSRNPVLDDYRLGKTLGKGHFATVKLVEKISTGETAALKMIEYDEASSRQMENIRRELAAMRGVQHDNIVSLQRFVDRISWPHGDGRPREVLLMELELCPGGDLFDYILHGGALPEPYARGFFCQLLSALQACHAKGVYHRDIKPENILLSADFQLKVGDFGLAIDESAGKLLRTTCGTRSYQGPEVLARKPYEGSGADVWSSGVVLFIMMLGNPPFRVAAPGDWWYNAININRYDQFWAAHQRPPAPPIPQAARDIINSIFRLNPAQRIGIDQLLASDWLQMGSDGATPIPSNEELRDFMAARKETIDTKNRAQQDALRAKQQEARRNQGGAFEASKTVYRSMHSAEAKEASPEPPLIHSVGAAGTYEFYSTTDPGVMMDWLKRACEDVRAEEPVMSLEDCTLDVVIPSAGQKEEDMQMHLQIYRLSDRPEDQGIYGIAATRCEGSPFEFGVVWKDILDSLKNLGDEGAEDALQNMPDVQFKAVGLVEPTEPLEPAEAEGKIDEDIASMDFKSA